LARRLPKLPKFAALLQLLAAVLVAVAVDVDVATLTGTPLINSIDFAI
jgi:hypothetical protein